MTRPGPSLTQLQTDVERRARDAGLDVPTIVYEVVDHRQLNEIAAYGGFPVRYPHWRFGMEYDRLIKGHAYGLQKIYELVVNTDPVVAYLLSQNAPVEQKLVMAHVCGHADFFQNNAWFEHTDRQMMDGLASHGSRVRRLMEEHGVDVVESFIDTVLSLDNLIDPGALVRARGAPGNAPPLDREASDRDVLGHLLLRAPLKSWQQELLGLLRDEAYYFLPQMLTKVMNEGWASFWHSRLMTHELLRDAEVVDYAEQHSSAMGGDGPINPYKLGLELFRAIHARAGGDRGDGLAAAFQERRIHNDLSFLDAHLDLEMVAQLGLGSTREECHLAREQMLASFTNAGQPVLTRSTSAASEELGLRHVWSGVELQLDAAEGTLRSLAQLWGGSVTLDTRLDGRELRLRCVGEELSRDVGALVAPGADQAAGSAPVSRRSSSSPRSRA